MLSALSAKRNHSTWTDSGLIINNITQYRSTKGYYIMGFCSMQAGIDPSHHGST